MVPAAFGVIAKEFKVTHQQASYLTTSYTLLGGLTPLLLTPYVNLYGRRPAYLVRSFPSLCALILIADHRFRSPHSLQSGRTLAQDTRAHIRGRLFPDASLVLVPVLHWLSEVLRYVCLQGGAGSGLTYFRFVICSTKANVESTSASTLWLSPMGYVVRHN